jgi:hypothetical protein
MASREGAVQGADDAYNEHGGEGGNVTNPHAHIRSLPPEGAAASLGAARREAVDDPHAHIRSLPPEEAAASLGAARREAV